MAEPIPTNQTVQEDTSSTVTIVATDSQDGSVPILHVKLKKPKADKKVQWTTETVDNEEMNKKKSKCCCIYTKPKKFDDSSSSEDSDDECDHCQGHVEKKKHKKHIAESSANRPSSNTTVIETDPGDSGEGDPSENVKKVESDHTLEPPTSD